MCDFKSSPKEIEHSSENNAIFTFLDFFVFTFFFFSIITLYSLKKFHLLKKTLIVHIKIFFFCFCRFVCKVILFQEALQFKEVIILCYNMKNFVRMNARVPPPFT